MLISTARLHVAVLYAYSALQKVHASCSDRQMPLTAGGASCSAASPGQCQGALHCNTAQDSHQCRWRESSCSFRVRFLSQAGSNDSGPAPSLASPPPPPPRQPLPCSSCSPRHNRGAKTLHAAADADSAQVLLNCIRCEFMLIQTQHDLMQSPCVQTSDQCQCAYI